jgi:adenine deaminase
MVVEIPTYQYPEWALKSVHLDTLTNEDFRIPVGSEMVKVRVMEVVPGMVHTEEHFVDMQPVDGSLCPDPARDLAKVGVFYRHEPKEGATGTKGFSFVRGVKLNPGCAYASTVSHDCHNLLVIGMDDDAMVLAANKLIEVGGGIAIVVDGKLETVMPLPLAGLMSLESVEVAAQQASQVETALKKSGCPYDSFEMTLSLLGLIVLEELHLSNRGLVELKPGTAPKFVDLLVKEN